VGRACGTHGRGKKRLQGLVGKPDGKRPLERRYDGLKTNLREIGLGGVVWIHLVQDMDRWQAVVNAVMNLRVLAPQS
jgi:hypothetical protein